MVRAQRRNEKIKNGKFQVRLQTQTGMKEDKRIKQTY